MASPASTSKDWALAPPGGSSYIDRMRMLDATGPVLIALALLAPVQASAQTDLFPTPPADSTLDVMNHIEVACPLRFYEWTNVDSTTEFRVRLVRDGSIVHEAIVTGPSVPIKTGHEAVIADKSTTMYCEIVGTNTAGAGAPLHVHIRVGNAFAYRRSALSVLNDVSFPVGFATPVRRRLPISAVDRSWAMRSHAEAYAYRGAGDFVGADVRFFKNARDLRHYFAQSTCAKVAARVAKLSTAKRRIEVVSCRPTTLRGGDKARTWIFKTSYMARGVRMATVSVETYGRTVDLGLFVAGGTRSGRATKFSSNLRAVLRYQVPFRQRVALRTMQE